MAGRQDTGAEFPTNWRRLLPLRGTRITAVVRAHSLPCIDSCLPAKAIVFFRRMTATGRVGEFGRGNLGADDDGRWMSLGATSWQGGETPPLRFARVLANVSWWANACLLFRRKQAHFTEVTRFVP